jgi:ribosomal protein S18 acetylase RimI-like enzyme
VYCRWFFAGCCTNRASSLLTTIRRATSADLPAIESLYVELKRHHHELVPTARRYSVPEEDWVAAIRASFSDPNTSFFVAEDAGTVMAFMRLRIDDRSWGKACEVDTVVVSAAYRSQGIGQDLMQEAEEHARNEGARAMRVNVLSVNDAGRDFYGRLGYELVAHRFAKDLD